MYFESDRPIAHVARDLGIHKEALRQWVRQADADQPPSAHDLLLAGLTTRFTESYDAGAQILKQALRAFRREKIPRADETRWLWLACWVAMELRDNETWDVLSIRHVQLVRDAGALTLLPIALRTRIDMYLYEGELAPAASLIDEVETVNEATGSYLAPYGALGLAAVQGREAEASELVQTTVKEVSPRGEGFELTVTEWATARNASSPARSLPRAGGLSPLREQKSPLAGLLDGRYWARTSDPQLVERWSSIRQHG